MNGYVRRPVSIAIGMLTIAALAPRLAAQSFGAALVNLEVDLDGAIRTAATAADRLRVSAGTEAYIAIENARVAYAKSLDATAKQYDASMQKTLDELRSLVGTVKQGTDSTLRATLSRVQTITDALPFASKDPYLENVAPHFIVPSGTDITVDITFTGRFLNAKQRAYRPVLRIDTTSYELTPADNSDQVLTFEIPTNRFRPIDMGGVSYARFELLVPYDKPLRYFPIFSVKETATYHLRVGMLPPTPGVIVVMQRADTTIRDTRQARSPSSPNELYHQHSNGSNIPNDPEKDLQPYDSEQPEAGWSIDCTTTHLVADRLSGRIDIPGDGGNWEVRTQQTRCLPTVVTYGVATKRKTCPLECGLQSGEIDFHYEYLLYRNRDSVRYVKYDTISLYWGDSKIFPYASGKWLIRFTPFDKKSGGAEYSQAGTYGLLNIQSGDDLQVEAIEPENFRTP